MTTTFIASQELDNEASCLAHLEAVRWNELVQSPFIPTSKVYHCSSGKYKCRDSGKYFTAKTNTIFHNSRVPLQIWFKAIMILQENPSTTSVNLAEKIGTTQKTAWHLIQKMNRKLPQSALQMNKLVPPPVKSLATNAQDRLNVVQWLNLIR